MKTSIELADNLFQRARKLAKNSNTTMRALIEEGLRYVLARYETQQEIKPKVLTFGGDGLTEEYSKKGYSWETVVNEVYEDNL